MKVKDLIKELSRFDGETTIVCQNDNYHSMGFELRDFDGYPTLVIFNDEEQDNE